MDTVRNLLKPLIQMFPGSVQEFLNSDAGVIVLLIAIVVVVGGGALVLLRLLRSMSGPRKDVQEKKEQRAELDMETLSKPSGPPPAQRLYIRGEAMRLRLIVLAPAGTVSDLDLSVVDKLLDRAVPGLSKQYSSDRPTVKFFPVQVSTKGFAPTFFRKTGLNVSKGQPSRWVLVAGSVAVGKKSVCLGLALWADKPSTIGMVSVDADDWQDVCKLRKATDDDD
jgi:hypothetical protein